MSALLKDFPLTLALVSMLTLSGCLTPETVIRPDCPRPPANLMTPARLSPALPDRDLGDRDMALITDMRRENERYVVHKANELIAWYDTWVLKPQDE